MAVELKNAAFDLMAAESPLCESDFPAACARSVENAASAQNLVLLRSGKTSHSGKVQQGSGVEFTSVDAPFNASCFLSDSDM